MTPLDALIELEEKLDSITAEPVTCIISSQGDSIFKQEHAIILADKLANTVYRIAHQEFPSMHLYSTENGMGRGTSRAELYLDDVQKQIQNANEH